MFLSAVLKAHVDLTVSQEAGPATLSQINATSDPVQDETLELPTAPAPVAYTAQVHRARWV